MANNGTTPLQIPSNLIKNVKLQGKDTLAEKHTFELIGTNGSIQIEPKIVKFPGFEIGKLNITKVKVINASTKAQRVHILSPSTPYFTIKFDKKGQLVSGMSEDIYIHFTPGEHKYYFDTIRVHTEDEQLQIPIHAFPVMSRENVKDIFPKLIDFGIVPVGSTEIMKFPLTCKIPLNFEYEFAPKKEHPDIVINPLSGTIPGKGTTEIEVVYTPSDTITVAAEYELNISQFDFDPIKVKIVGSGKLKEKEDGIKESRGITKRGKLSKLDTIRISTVDQLKFTSDKGSESMTTFLNLRDGGDRIRESNFHEDDPRQYKSLIRQKSRQKEETIIEEKRSTIMNGNKSIPSITSTTPNSRQALEKRFLDRFNEVAQLDKEKNIKFFQCIGDPTFTKDNEQEILNERETNKQIYLDNYERAGITRYNLLTNQDYPCVGEIYPTFAPTFDELKNDNIRKRKEILHRIVSAVSKVILRHRASTRLKKIKITLSGAKTVEEVKQLVLQDWQRAEYFGIGKKDHVVFSFEKFNTSSILDIRLPIQLENSSTNLSHKFEINQRIGFDDFAPIEPLPYSDLEVMGYRVIPTPTIINYPPIEADRKNRRCAEEEYALSGPIGPFEVVNRMDRELVEPCPPNLIKPLNIESHRFLCPHPNLKTFTPLIQTVETDPEFELQPSKIPVQDSLDPTFETDYDIIKREFLSSTSGMEGTRFVSVLPLEFTNYFTHKLTVTYDFGFENDIEKNCPDIMDKPYDEDKFSDEDSDEKKSVDSDVPELDDFMDLLEKDEAKLKDVKKRNDTTIYDENESTLESINKNYETEKDLWFATLPTRVNELNKNITSKEDLINLL